MLETFVLHVGRLLLFVGTLDPEVVRFDSLVSSFEAEVSRALSDHPKFEWEALEPVVFPLELFSSVGGSLVVGYTTKRTGYELFVPPNFYCSIHFPGSEVFALYSLLT